MSERVQVYVRVRPIFKHELLEDIRSAQTTKQLQMRSPSQAAKNNGYKETTEADDMGKPVMQSDEKTGCVRFVPN